MARYYDFAGQKIILPGSYTKRTFPEDEGAGNYAGECLILGEAKNGGIPFDAYEEVEDTVNVVSGQAQALNVFGGGDLYYGAEFYLTPSKDERFNTPGEAKCIVVNKMKQASGVLKSGSTEIIALAACKFGTDGNQIGVLISEGSTAGKRIKIVSKGEEMLNKDNDVLNLMSIQYVGQGEAAVMTITADKLTTTVTGAEDDNLDIAFADFADMGSLINFINGKESYDCTLTGKSDEKTVYFDAVTDADIKSEAYSCFGNVEAVIRTLNATDIITAELATGAERISPDNMTSYQFLEGGEVNLATNQRWADCLTKLEKYDCNCLVIMSGSEAVHQIVNDHVTRMNAVKIKKYRQAIFGAGSAANTKKLKIAEMKSLNSAYIEYCVSPFKRYDYVNKTTPAENFEPYYLAPIIAGIRYANSVGMDIVFKYVNVLSTPEIEDKDQEDFAEAGGTLIQKRNNVLNGNKNFEILVNNTTFQGSQVTRTNPGAVYEANVLTKYYEEWLTEQLRALDTVANSVVIATIQNKITTELFPKFRDDFKWITDYTDPETGAVQKAFDNVSFSQSGEQFITKALLTMSVTPRFAFNFFTFVVPGQNA